MTVEELEKSLHGLKNKQAKVIMSGYYDAEVNGYYTGIRDGEEVLYFTRIPVQSQN